jgi:hypothetical protein
MNLSLLIHTFNGYQHLWSGCASSFCKHWDQDIPLYFGTDTETRGEYLFPYTTHLLFSGPGEWSDRLRSLLQQIPTEYVLYMQEDHWPTQSPPNLAHMMQIMTEKKLLRLQISPIVPFYSLFSEENTLFFDVKSKYLVSHQPSIWKKSFLLDCLKPGETPWVNEYKGTLRLQQNSQIRDFIRNKIAIYPCEWYKHMCIKGKMVES